MWCCRIELQLPGSADRKKSDAHKKFHGRKSFRSVFSAIAPLYRAKDPGSLRLGSIIYLCLVKAAASDRATPDRNVVGLFAIILSTAVGKQKADRSTAAATRRIVAVNVATAGACCGNESRCFHEAPCAYLTPIGQWLICNRTNKSTEHHSWPLRAHNSR